MTTTFGDRPAGAAGRVAGWIWRISVGLAVAGGVLMLALALVVTASVLLRWLAGRQVPGDFELVQMGVSIATFAFLPLCQLRSGNIFVDTFTTRMPRRVQVALDRLWALVYAVIAGLVAWRMGIGAIETIASGTTSMVLAMPIGWAILLATLFSAWLTLVVLATAVGAARRAGT